MKILNWNEMVEQAVRQMGQPAVYVSNRLVYDDLADDDAWWHVISEMKTIYGDGTPEFFDVTSALIYDNLFFFDDEDQQQRFYQVFMQPPLSRGGIYACTYSADGQCRDSNDW